MENKISETLNFIKTTSTSDNIRADIPQGSYNGLLLYSAFDVESASDTAKSDFTQIINVYKNGKMIGSAKMSDLLAVNNYKYGYPVMSGASVTTKYAYAVLDIPVQIGANDTGYFTISNIPAGNSTNTNDIYGLRLDQPAMAQILDYFSPSVADKEIFTLNKVKSLYITASDETKIGDIEIVNTDTKETLISAPFNRIAAASKMFHNLEATENGCLIDLTEAQNIRIQISVSSTITLTLLSYSESDYIAPHGDIVVPGITPRPPESKL